MKKTLGEVIFILIFSISLMFGWEWAAPRMDLAEKVPPSEMLAFLTFQPKPVVKKKLIPALPVIKQPDTSRQRILLTGDSMSEGLLFPFIEYCKISKHEFTAIPVYSSTTLSFSKSDTLSGLIKKYKPTYIILTLGSNELFIRNIEKRDTCVKKILKQAGDIKMVWIGPPNWKKDTGINELIRSEIGEKRFFESQHLTFERARDGAHPTRSASRIWADTIIKWLKNPHKCEFPIVIKTDTSRTYQPPKKRHTPAKF